eukprot:2181485-Rhodomonas_salina.1
MVRCHCRYHVLSLSLSFPSPVRPPLLAAVLSPSLPANLGRAHSCTRLNCRSHVRGATAACNVGGKECVPIVIPEETITSRTFSDRDV